MTWKSSNNGAGRNGTGCEAEDLKLLDIGKNDGHWDCNIQGDENDRR